MTRGSAPTRPRRSRVGFGVAAVWLALGGAVARAVAGEAAGEAGIPSFADFLALKRISLGERAAFAASGPWADAQDLLVVRVLLRLAAPASLEDRWRTAAVRAEPRGRPQPLGDRLVAVRGRATFVAPRRLPGSAAAGRSRYDVVRIVDERGAVVDVVVPDAPRAWPRWRTIDEPAEAVGLPLAAGAGPEPSDGDGNTWPPPRCDLLLAAVHVAWRPATMLGGLGVDHALFDTVVDDRRLEPGDAAAFWAVLEAATRTTAAELAREAGGTTDVLSLIDPARGWFATHRGEPVVVEGVARRITRIEIDDPVRRTAMRTGHYWELEVFADTPAISVAGRVQDRYPVVCCTARLPAGFPVGDSVSERVRVAGFGFKRYGYPLRDGPSRVPPAAASTPAERMSTALLIGPTVVWVRPPARAGASGILFGAFAAIAGLVAATIWASARGRRRRASLPDRLELPDD